MRKVRKDLRICLERVNKALDSKSYSVSDYNDIIDTIAAFNTDFEKRLITKYQNKDLSRSNIDDDIGSIKFLFNLILILYELLPLYAEKIDIPFKKPSILLETTQFFFKTYASENELKEYQNKFGQINLPITGFLKKGKIKMKKKYQPNWIMLVFGIIMLTIYCLFAFVMKTNSSYKYLLNRGLFAIGVPLVLFSFFDGLLKLKISKTSSPIRFAIDATGGIALFLVLFFGDPASAPEYKTPSEIEAAQKTYIYQSSN